MRLRITVPETLVCAANGRLEGVKANGDGTRTYNWFVSTPINNYSVALNIAPGATLTPAGGATVVRVDPDINNELFHQFNLTGQWEFSPNWLAEVGYVGSRGRNLLVVRNIGTSGSGFPGSRSMTTKSTS